MLALRRSPCGFVRLCEFVDQVVLADDTGETMTVGQHRSSRDEAFWRNDLTRGDSMEHYGRLVFGRIPSDPRCRPVDDLARACYVGLPVSTTAGSAGVILRPPGAESEMGYRQFDRIMGVLSGSRKGARRTASLDGVADPRA